MPFLLGIDIGSYESKGVLTDLHGRIVAHAALPHEMAIPRPGWAEHDADGVWWHDFSHLSRELLRQSGVSPQEVAGVGCSAIGPCVLPVDRAGKPLRTAILYGIDTRALEQVAELTNLLGEDWILAEAGSALSSQAAGPKILWLQRHEPEIWARTWRVLTSTSYLVYRLTDQVVIDHYTATGYGPMYNLRQCAWDAHGLAPICDARYLPALGWSTQVIGQVTPQAAAETGLAAGTPVIIGTCDASAEAISAGVTQPGDTMLMYGTTLFFVEICSALPKGGLLWPAVFLEPGTYALAAGMSTTGALTRWFRDQFAQAELQVEQAGGANAYGALAAEAATTPPGAEGLLLLPYFSGERTPLNDPLARGVVAGLTLSHTRGHLYRAVLEGTAYGVRHNLEAMAAAGEPARQLVAIGGGVKNRLWLQLVSDVTGREQVVRTTPGAAYGDALLAGVGVGLIPKIADVHHWLGEPDVVRPNPAVKPLYDQYYGLYRRLYEASQDVVHELARLGSGQP